MDTFKLLMVMDHMGEYFQDIIAEYVELSLQCVTCKDVIGVEVNVKTCEAHVTKAVKCSCGMRVRMRVRSPTDEEKQDSIVANLAVGDSFTILKDVISDLEVTYEAIAEGNEKFFFHTKQMEWNEFMGIKLERVKSRVWVPNPPIKRGGRLFLGSGRGSGSGSGSKSFGKSKDKGVPVKTDDISIVEKKKVENKSVKLITDRVELNECKEEHEAVTAATSLLEAALKEPGGESLAKRNDDSFIVRRKKLEKKGQVMYEDRLKMKDVDLFGHYEPCTWKGGGATRAVNEKFQKELEDEQKNLSQDDEGDDEEYYSDPDLYLTNISEGSQKSNSSKSSSDESEFAGDYGGPFNESENEDDDTTIRKAMAAERYEMMQSVTHYFEEDIPVEPVANAEEAHVNPQPNAVFANERKVILDPERGVTGLRILVLKL